MYGAIHSRVLRGGILALALGLASASGVSAQDADLTQGIGADKVVTVGTWVPRSGPLAGLGSAGIDGALIAFDQLNAAGGVNGYTVHIDEVDDGYDPARTVAAVRQLWQEDKVFAIFHPYGSPTTQAAARFVTANEVPMLFPLASAGIFGAEGAPTPTNYFGYYPYYDQIIYSAVDYAMHERGDKRIGIILNHGEFGQAGTEAMEKAAKRYGFEPGNVISYPLNETNFVSIGRRIAESGDDATLVWSVVGGVQIMAAAEQAGYKGDWLIQTALVGKSAVAEYRKIASLTNRIILPHFQLMPNDDAPEIKAFLAAFQQRFPDSDVNVGLMGYTNAMVFAEGLKRATADGTELTWPGMRKALLSIDRAPIAASPSVSYKDNKVGNSLGRMYVWDGDNWKAASEFTPLPER